VIEPHFINILEQWYYRIYTIYYNFFFSANTNVNYLNDSENFIEVDPLITPIHIQSE